MFYIGINQRVHPDDASLSGNNLFAIICIYLFVVFYSFGWGPIPYVVSSEVSPNHGTYRRSPPVGFETTLLTRTQVIFLNEETPSILTHTTP